MGWVSVLQNLGGALGIYAFKTFTQRIGRRPAFAVAFVLAMLSTAGTFWFLNRGTFWLLDGFTASSS